MEMEDRYRWSNTPIFINYTPAIHEFKNFRIFGTGIN